MQAFYYEGLFFMELIRELYQKQSLFVFTALFYALALVLFLILSKLDHRLVNGYNTWYKPMKFALSLLPYFLSLAWIWPHLTGQGSAWLALALVLLMHVEMLLITMQAARAVPSHFNNATAFDAGVFSVMGTAIFINTLLLVYLFFVSFSTLTELSSLQAWAWRLGLLFLILGSSVGGMMGAKNTHSVGVDVGNGLPFLGWNRDGGDLRIMHFLGIHALQVFPLFAWLSEKWLKPISTIVFVGLAFLYLCSMIYLLVLTLQGRSIFPLKSNS